MYVCVVCSTALEEAEGGLSCRVCRKRYPYLPGGIPLLVASPERLAAQASAEIGGLRLGAEQMLAALAERVRRGTPRARALGRMRAGLASSVALFDRWLAAMAPLHAPAPPPTRAGFDRDRFVAVFRSLAIDWTFRPACEELLTIKLGAIRRQLAHAGARRRLVVLGAGMGRVACELAADFDEVIAVDLSLPLALTFAELTAAPLSIHEPIDVNVAGVDDLYPEVELRMPHPPERVRYVVADALATPLPPGSASAVLCDYFTDMVAPTQLVRECRRLLAPGGALVHFGPLGYPAHIDVEETFTAEELRELLAREGFALRAEEWVPHVYWPSAMLMDRRVRGWSFAAVRKD